MNPAPIFSGIVTKAGHLRLDDQRKFLDHLRGYRGKSVEVVVRRLRSRRSLEQNSYWHAVPVTIMADFMGEDHMATHYALLGECFGYHAIRELGRDAPNKPSSSRLTTEEFSQLIEWCPRWALENFNVTIPLPHEADWEGAS